jgi:hypothetical protein
MNKQELKKVLKPLIKECVKEVMFEQGVLSGIISEVVQGLSTNSIKSNASQQPPKTQELVAPTPRVNMIHETKKKMLDAIGKDAFGGIDLFEGTAPLSKDASSASSPENASGPMANIDANDPGVDIRGIMNLAGGNWKQIG